MKLALLVATSAEVAASSRRLDKTAKLAALLGQLSGDEVAIAVGFLIGWPRQGKIGVGWASAVDARNVPAASEATLELHDVDGAFTALQGATGKGSTARRSELLRELFARATPDEQQFLASLITGEVRQGALEGVLLDAVAKAATVDKDELRRAVMLAGELGAVASAVLSGGGAALDALASYRLELFRPVQPMLADSAHDVVEAIRPAGDGQVASSGSSTARASRCIAATDRVAVYTRNLNDVTARCPKWWTWLLALTARELILDGEVIALASDGRPAVLPGHDASLRPASGRRQAARRAPLTPFFFDVLLHNEGETLIDRPLAERLARLDRLVARRHARPARRHRR